VGVVPGAFGVIQKSHAFENANRCIASVLDDVHRRDRP
jgi:hypothetical protein